MISAKRMVDLIGSAVGLLLTWPVFVVIAVAIKAEDGGPVFFRQQRVGLRGRLFQTWKFRTMRNVGERRPSSHGRRGRAGDRGRALDSPFQTRRAAAVVPGPLG